MKLRALLLSMGLIVVGCGSEVTTDGGDGGDGGKAATGSGTQSTSSTGDPIPGSESATFGPITVQPGQENTQCVEMKLHNASQLRVHQIHNVLSQGSHHMIVYRTNDTVEQLTPYDCQPFVDTLHPEKGSPLMVTQKHDETLTLPEGVAFTLQPEQMIRLEVHYINPTTAPLQLTATSTFVPIAEGAFQYEADFLFLGDPDINIAANSQATVGPVFLPLGKLIPDIVGGANFFALTGHTHQFGTDVKVNLATSATDPGTPVYDVPGWTWSEPATVVQDPPFSVSATGGFKFSCSWDNTSPNTVKFGESANDEMCFFWAYYYPSKGAFVCAHTDQIPGGFDLCCPGNALCDQVFP